MAGKEHIRCPCCGMVVTRAKFNRDYPLEVLWQEYVGKGKGGFKWTKPKVNGMWILRLALKTKLKRLLAILEREDTIREFGYAAMEPCALEMNASWSRLARMESSTSQLNLTPVDRPQERRSSTILSGQPVKASVSWYLPAK